MNNRKILREWIDVVEGKEEATESISLQEMVSVDNVFEEMEFLYGMLKEMISEEDFQEDYMGFEKLKHSLAHRKDGVRDAGATAASIGRKKYGKSKFQKAAAAGKKMRGMESVEETTDDLEEKWGTKAKVKSLDKWGEGQKTLAELKSRQSALRKKNDKSAAETKELRQINFAIRSRTGWGAAA